VMERRLHSDHTYIYYVKLEGASAPFDDPGVWFPAERIRLRSPARA